MSDHILQKEILSKNDTLIFTERELSCFEKISRGETLIEITAHLGIAKNTAYFYVSNIANKLDMLLRQGRKK